MVSKIPPNKVSGETLVFAVVSDLHAYEVVSGAAAPSLLCISQSDNEPSTNPVAGMLELIEREQLKADYLLCPGDLADKAHPASIKYAWDAVTKISQKLSSKRLIATSGNHDLDSRYVYNDYDAKGVLQGLLPAYPLGDESLNDRYWSRNYAIINEQNVRIVVLNSSAFHGGPTDEIQHGRISERTLERLKSEFESLEKKPVNILLCHHHPQHHSEFKLGESDVMKNGQLLLDMLGLGTFGDWIVIHGHKHHPKLTYAAGGSSSPVVFSSASFSASIYPELQSHTRNQFHIITIPLGSHRRLELVGTVRSWTWSHGVGWDPSDANSGLPRTCGFGCRTSVATMAEMIKNIVGSEKFLWAQLVSELPDLEFLVPNDMTQLVSTLEQEHSIRILDYKGVHAEVAKAI